MEPRNLKNYYDNLQVERVWLPNNPQFRQFKFFLEDGNVIKIRKKIRKKEQLYKYFTKYNPLHCYYTLSKYINPLTVSTKEKRDSGYAIDTCLIGADLCFDIDCENLSIEEYERTRQVAVKVLDWFKGELRYVCMTGKGWHLVYKDKTKIPKKIKDRIPYLEKKRKELIKTIPKDIKKYIDLPILQDIMRIVRIPQTINSKVNISAKLLTPEELRLPISKIGNRLGILEKGNDKRLLGTARGKDRTNLMSSPFYLQFAVSKVGKLNRFVLFLKYDKKLEHVEKDIKRLQKLYKLPDFYILKIERDEKYPQYYCVCLKTMQLRRIQKIRNNSNSITPKQFILNYLRVSDMLLEDKSIYRKKPKYIKTIKSENRKDFVSKPHLKLLRNIFDVPVENYSLQHGDVIGIKTYRGKL